ncbi:MAG: class I SAM-dependent methyltransferase [Terriglobales bacterium]
MNALVSAAPILSAAAMWMRQLRCPYCGRDFAEVDIFAVIRIRCECGFTLRNDGGIVRALVPESAAYFEQFVREYGEVRAREGRSGDDAYYLALPFEDRTGRNSWQWSIRAKTFRYFTSRVLSRIERHSGKPLDVLDIGAGNGWLSYRMTLRGHRCAAVDLLDNAWDGLGAAHHYRSHSKSPFALLQAEMDRLPFADRQFDLIIFNASFHYSTDYVRTVRESLRCLRPGGSIVMLDTPYYHHESSGAAMVREREGEFQRKYGFRSNSVPSSEFVSRGTLDRLARDCGIRWQVFKPWYGWNWALRPWKARLRRRRQPSKFYLLWGRTEA